MAALVSIRQYLAQRDLLEHPGTAQLPVAPRHAHRACPTAPWSSIAPRRCCARAASRRHPGRGAVRRHRRLQAGQRQPRARRRRSAAADRRGTALARSSASADTVGRLGGDEFVVLLEDYALDAGPEMVAERHLRGARAADRACDDGGRADLSVTVSIGIADRAACTRRRAAARRRPGALRGQGARARTAGSCSNRRCRPSCRIASSSRWTSARRSTRDEFFLLYQPTFDLQTETITGVEALAALAPPRRAASSTPTTFIPIAEEIGPDRADRPLGAAHGLRPGRRLAARTAATLRHRRSTSRRASSTSRSWSPRSPMRSSRRDSIRPRLTLEITETTLMRDSEAAARRLRRAQGARGPHRDRRLRHRLQLARLPAPVPRRRAQDRPVLHRRARRARTSPKR